MSRSVTPMISAASHQVIFFALAFNNTSCIFIIRSTSAAGYRFAFSNHSASPLPPQSGQITCELDRTDHILTTKHSCPLAFQEKQVHTAVSMANLKYRGRTVTVDDILCIRGLI